MTEDLLVDLKACQAGEYGGYAWDLCGKAAEEIGRLRGLLMKAEQWVNIPMQASDAAGLRAELRTGYELPQEAESHGKY
jgi:hypothetical protein